MSQATTDPTLEALAPRGSAWHGVALAVVAVLVLVAAWVVPAWARPTIGGDGSAMGAEFPSERRELVLTNLAPHAWGGVTVSGVDDVAGAHVVGAWAVEGNRGSNAPAGTRTSDGDLARLGVTDADRLPRTLASGQPATLVVLWQIESCQTAARVADSVPVHVRGLLGVARVETVPAAPMLGGVTWSDGTPCRP